MPGWFEHRLNIVCTSRGTAASYICFFFFLLGRVDSNDHSYYSKSLIFLILCNYSFFIFRPVNFNYRPLQWPWSFRLQLIISKNHLSGCCSRIAQKCPETSQCNDIFFVVLERRLRRSHRNVLIKKLFLKSHNIHRKIPVLDSLFNKKDFTKNFIEKILKHKCFPVNVAKFLRIP